MGMRTDFEIASWQEQAGIKPASGERAELLNALSRAAFETIKVIELERSGIRDGDGRWHGSDVIGHITDDLTKLCKRLNEFDRAEWMAEHWMDPDFEKEAPWAINPNDPGDPFGLSK